LFFGELGRFAKFLLQPKGETKMQSNTNKPSTQLKHPWYKSKMLAIFMFVLATLNWIFVGAYVSGQMEIKPTLLVIKQDGCDFLLQSGFSIQTQAPTGSCRVTVPFRSNLIGDGGRAYIDDREIQIAGSQVTVIAALDGQPWSPKQQHLMILLGICMVLVIAMATWVYFLFSKKG